MLNRIITSLAACQVAQFALAQQQIIDEIVKANDDQPTCEQQPFCDRYRSLMDSPDLIAKSDVYYSMDADSVKCNFRENQIEATLNLASSSDGTVAQSLDLTMVFYQNGIMRLLIEEPGVKRFRISQEDLPVVDEQLERVELMGHFDWQPFY